MPGSGKPRSCVETDCPFPALKRRKRCGWHWLMKQPAIVQQRAAAARKASAPPAMQVSRVAPSSWPQGTRFCSGCYSFVPLFYCTGSRCKACASAASHASGIQKRFGITAAQYSAMLEAQGGRCAICRQVPRSKRLAVDHNHVTGEIRGLLCSGKDRSGCNVAIGILHDDAEIVQRAADYLKNPPARRVLV